MFHSVELPKMLIGYAIAIQLDKPHYRLIVSQVYADVNMYK